MAPSASGGPGPARRALAVAVTGGLAVALLVGLLVAGGVVGGDDGTSTDPTTTTPRPPAAGQVRINLAFSPEKEGMLQSLIARYNAEERQVNGKVVVVTGEKWSSGDAQAKIAKGIFKPVAWSPSSSLWGRLLNYQADKPYVADENPSLVRTPLVIAMWEAAAKALGWPRKQTSWAQILEMATAKVGWARFGLPTYGDFRLGHTNPDFSTSGLSAVAAQYYAVTGKREGLTVADVSGAAVRKKVQQIQQSVVHYGDTTLFFADQLKAHGPAYASAVAMEEVTLLDYNKTRPPGSERLLPQYPSDGTFFSDNPYFTLNAPWVTADQKQASDEFGAWLVKEITPALAAQYGFRPGDPEATAVAPIDRAHGVLLAQPARVLGLPQPEVLAKIKSAWREDRKPANVLLVVDVSGSMQEDNKIGEAKKGLQLFLRQLSPRDRVGLLFFNGAVNYGVPIDLFKKQKRTLRETVSLLVADGDTALYDAVSTAVDNVDALSDDTRINAVVVLSDGQDTASATLLPSLLSRLERRSSGEKRQIRVFTIAYGDGADQTVLEKIANASGGKAYVGDPDEIEKVYLQISSFF